MKDKFADRILEVEKRYKIKYLETGNKLYLNKAILYLKHKSSCSEFSDWDPKECSKVFTELGFDYLDRYLAFGSQKDLENAFLALKKSIKQFNKKEVQYYQNANNIATYVRTIEYANQNESIIKNSIGLYEEALYGIDKKSEEYQLLVGNLAIANKQMFEITRDQKYIDRSIELNEEIYRLFPKVSLNRSIFLNNYGNALLERFKLRKVIDDIIEAIKLQKEALSSSNLEPENEAIFQSNLSYSYMEKYGATSSRDDLLAVIESIKRSIDLTPENSPYLSKRLGTYANSLIWFFRYDGSKTHLDDAIKIIDAALPINFKQDNDMSLADLFFLLSMALRLRYDSTGSINDLQRSLEAQKKVVELYSEGLPGLPYQIADLSILFAELYSVTYDPYLLKSAELGLLQAIDLSKNDKEFIARTQHNLSHIIRSFFDITGDRVVLDKAIQYHNLAIENTPVDSNELATRIAGLAQDLICIYDLTGDQSYLDDAILKLQNATSMSTLTMIEEAQILASLSEALAKRHEKTKSQNDLLAATDSIRKSMELAKKSSISLLFTVARTWAYWAQKRQAWDEAVIAFENALSAADELIQIQMTLGHQANQIGYLADINIYASYAFLKTGRINDSIMALERGRTRLLLQPLILKNLEIQNLYEINPLLAESVIVSANRLASVYRKAFKLPLSVGIEPTDSDVSIIVSEWKRVTSEVKKLSGFEKFGSSPSFQDILSVAVIKPIVYVTANYWEGFAILIMPSGETFTIWLPMLTTVALHRLLPDILSRLGRDYTSYQSVIDEVCSWFWKTAMEPISFQLQSRGYNEAFLIPCGELANFPLHAAWTVDESRPSRRLYALDLINYSYAPSAKSILMTLKATSTPIESILIIEDPSSSLPFATLETLSVLKYFTKKDLLGGEAATRELVLSRIAGNNIVHFSCHGYSDPFDSLQSGLIMSHDEALTIADLQQINLNENRLVVLSACDTGVSGRQLVDEIIGFPGALMGLGVPSIISSFWSVDDESTSKLMELFYKNMKISGLNIADALRQAQITLRDAPDKKYIHPYYWAAFYMTGS
jgi:hypothetical protein